MEEKESTVSGSLGNNSDTDSPPPPPVTSVMNVNNVSMQVLISNSTDTISATTTIPAPPVAELQEAALAPAPTIFGNAGNRGIGSGGEREKAYLAGKKKRGRPRKYDSDGKLRVQQQQPIINQIVAQPLSPPPGFSLTPSPDFHGFPSSKRGKGRPQGSGNWQVLASLGELFATTAGEDFTPHVVTVSTGEDVAGKILSFSHKGPRGICVLSANGAVSNVTIRQPGSSGGILTYEGRFEILSLSGSFTITETGCVRNRIGGLSVSLASPDGRVIGGGVAGLLLAASPIQIVVGSFMPNGYKAHKRKHNPENAVTCVIPGSPDMMPAARPITEVKPADGTTIVIPAARPITEVKPADGTTIVIPTAPLPGPDNGGTDDGDANEKHTPNAAYPSRDCWNGTQPASNYRPSPDINVPVPKEEDVQGVF